MLALNRWRFLLVGFVVALALYPLLNLLLWSFGLFHGPRLHDFAAYHDAANRFMLGYPLYDHLGHYTEAERYRPFGPLWLYPPIFVLPFVPFGLLPVDAAGVLWIIASFATLCTGAYALLSALDVELRPVQWVVVWWCLLGFSPTITWIKAGQVSGMLAAIFCFSAAYLERSRTDSPDMESPVYPGVSGALTAIPAVVKPFLAPAGGHLLRHRSRFIGGVIAGFVIFTVGIAIFGVQTHLEYLMAISSGKGWGTSQPPSSWSSVDFNPFYFIGVAGNAIRAILIIGVITLIVMTRRDRSARTDRLVFALGLILIPLANPSASTNTLNMLIPAGIVVLVEESRSAEGRADIVLIALLLVHFHPYTVEFLTNMVPRYLPSVESISVLVPLLQPGVWGVFLLFGWTTYQLQRRTMWSTAPFATTERA